MGEEGAGGEKRVIGEVSTYPFISQAGLNNNGVWLFYVIMFASSIFYFV